MVEEVKLVVKFNFSFISYCFEMCCMYSSVSDCLEQIDAQRVLGYVLFKDGKNIRLPYPLEKFHVDMAGRSFHNGRFIQRLREKAAALPG